MRKDTYDRIRSNLTSSEEKARLERREDKKAVGLPMEPLNSLFERVLPQRPDRVSDMEKIFRHELKISGTTVNNVGPASAQRVDQRLYEQFLRRLALDRPFLMPLKLCNLCGNRHTGTMCFSKQQDLPCVPPSQR